MVDATWADSRNACRANGLALERMRGADIV
jgi:hypothetical protein